MKEALYVVKFSGDSLNHFESAFKFSDCAKALSAEQKLQILKDNYTNLAMDSTTTSDLQRKTLANMSGHDAELVAATAPKIVRERISRKYISVKTKRAVLKQADQSCDYASSDGHRCGSQYQLQIDHRKPVAFA